MRHFCIEAASGQACNAGRAGGVADSTGQTLQARFAELAILIDNRQALQSSPPRPAAAGWFSPDIPT